jgi:DNA-binding NarL/FixJ family response regulator
VLIADSEPVFRTGMRKIFDGEELIEVVGQYESLEGLMAELPQVAADVLLLEHPLPGAMPTTAGEIQSKAPALRIILIMRKNSETDTVEALRAGVRGIVTRSITPELLLKCLHKVYNGETWLDNRGVNWVIEAYRSQAQLLAAPGRKVHLGSKELWVISGVTQGLRNKDIASEIGTSEQVIKNYLRKIYDKLGISDRMELALYCMHHRLLDGFEPPAKSKSRSGDD